MLYFACTKEYNGCATYIPYVSYVIAYTEMYERIFMLYMTFLTFGAFIPSVKGFYSKLDGVIHGWLNNVLLYQGIFSYIGLCYVGIFDYKNYNPLHHVSTGVFLISFTLYGFTIGQCFFWKRSHYLPREQNSIRVIFGCSWGVVVSYITVSFIAPYYDGKNLYWTAIAEWIYMMLAVNYFSLTSGLNTLYDTVHTISTPGKKQD